MSNTIDTRVVQMQFDNASFEKGVEQTTKSLANLDKTLDQVSGTGGGGSKLASVFSGLASHLHLDSITNAASGVAQTIGNIFSETARQVSTLSKIGLGTITALGAGVTALAATGGMRRALNIEQAKFQLEGLNVAWDAIYDDLDYAVSGTAYGLDSAAKAASQLVASNIEVGDSMKTALRGISGVAAMTNREYDDVAHIFTTVAGTGRLMGMQLTQLGAYGINAASAIAKYFREVRGEADMTEEKIREMTSQGKIDFQTFAEAMDWNYGEHAKDANNTFTGAMANTKAALSRIGAEFATPYMDNMKDVFNALIPFINMIKKSMTPIFSEFSSVMETGKKVVVDFLEPFTGLKTIMDDGTGVVSEIDRTAIAIANLKGVFQTLIDMGHYVGGIFSESFGAMADGLSKYWGFDKLPKGYEMLQAIFRSVTNFNKDVLQKLNLGDFFDALFGPIWVEGMQIKQVFDTIKQSLSGLNFVNVFNKGVEVFTIFSGLVEDALTIWNNFIMNGIEMAAPVVKDLAKVFYDFAKAFDKVFRGSHEYNQFVDPIVDGMKKIKNGFLDWYSGIRELLPTFSDFSNILGAFKNIIGGIASFAAGKFEAVGAFLTNLFSGSTLSAANTAAGVFEKVGHAVKFVLDTLHGFLEESGILPALRSFLETLSHTTISDLLGVFTSGILIQGLTTVHNLLKQVKSGVDDIRQWNAVNFVNLAGFGPAVNEVKKAFLVLQGTLNAKMIGEIAKSLLMIAAAMLVLSMIPFEKLITGSVALTYFALVLTTAFDMISKPAANFTQGFAVSKAVGLLIAISSSLLIMAAAMKLLSSMDAKGLIVSAIAMFTLVISLLAVVEAIGRTNEGALVKGGAVIAALGFAVLQMSIAMKILSSLSGNGLASALIGVTALAAVISILILVMDSVQNASGIVASAAMFATIGGAFVLMAASMKILSTMNASQAMTGILSMMALFTGIGALLAVLKNVHFSSLLSATLAFAAIGAAMLALAVSLSLLATVSQSGMVTAIAGMMGALIILVGAVGILGGLGAEAALGAAALVAISAAMLLLAPSIALLAALPVAGIMTAMLALVAVIGTVGIVASLVSPVHLLALAAALLSIGIAALGIGAGIGAAAAGIGVLALGIATLIQVVGQFTGTLGKLAVDAGVAFGKFVVSLVSTLAEAHAKIVEAGVTIGHGFLSSLGALIPDVIAFGIRVILAFLEGIANSIGEVASYGLQIVTNFILGIASGIGQLVSAGFQLVIMFIKGIADAFRTNRHMLENAITDVMATIGMAFLEGLASIVEGIPIFGKEMADGLRGQAAELEAAADAASSAVEKEFAEKNSDILENTSKTMDSVGDTIEEAGPGLIKSSEKTAGSVTMGFAAKLGLDAEMINNLGLTKDNLSDYIPILSGLSGLSAEEITKAFYESSADLPDVAEDRAEEAATAIDNVDYSTPGANNGEELVDGTADGIDDNSYKISDSAEDAMSNAVDSAYNEASYAGSAGDKFSSEVADGIDTTAANDEAASLVDNAETAAENASGGTYDTGYYMTQGLIDGMKSIAWKAIEVATTIAANAAAAYDAGAVVGSPSKLTTRTGKYVTMGLIVGMRSLESQAVTTAEDVAYNTAYAMTGMSTLLDGIDWDANPTITPVLDTSMVESGLGRLNGFFSTSQARQASWASGNYSIAFGSSGNNQNGGNTNNITVQLNYDAGADANDLVLGIARALRTTAIMEG